MAGRGSLAKGHAIRAKSHAILAIPELSLGNASFGRQADNLRRDCVVRTRTNCVTPRSNCVSHDTIRPRFRVARTHGAVPRSNIWRTLSMHQMARRGNAARGSDDVGSELAANFRGTLPGDGSDSELLLLRRKSESSGTCGVGAPFVRNARFAILSFQNLELAPSFSRCCDRA